jgi:hypothetical protein
MHAAADDQRSAALYPLPAVAGRGHRAPRSDSTWRQLPSSALIEGVQHQLGAHPAGREREWSWALARVEA